MGFDPSQHGFVSLHINPLHRNYPEILLEDPGQILRFIRALPGFGVVPRGISAGGWMPCMVLTFRRSDDTTVQICIHNQMTAWSGEHGDRFMDPARFEQVVRDAVDWWSRKRVADDPEALQDEQVPRRWKRSRRDNMPPAE